jgi:hypothetical protein
MLFYYVFCLYNLTKIIYSNDYIIRYKIRRLDKGQNYDSLMYDYLKNCRMDKTN